MNHLTIRLLVASIATACILTATPGLAAPGETDASVNATLAAIRRATAGFHDVSAAEEAHFQRVSPCVEAAGLGGMGFHYLNHARVDMTLNEMEPELLLYAPGPHGPQLAGVEYLIPALANTPNGPAPWFGAAPPPGGFASTAPTLFGDVTMDGPMPGHGAGEPWHYDLHVWVWKANPNGVFTAWHANIDCP